MGFDAAVTLSFFMLAVPAFFTPGPNNLMLMTSAARFGVRRTVPHAVGISIGFALMVGLVGLGLGEVFAAFPQLKKVLSYLAAAYFLWMAWHLLGLNVGQSAGRARPMRAIEAALFQWVNPKAWAMAVGLVGAFVTPGPARFQSVALLSLGALLLGPFSTSSWMFFGRQLQQFLLRTGGERYMGAVLAALMLGAVILFLI